MMWRSGWDSNLLYNYMKNIPKYSQLFYNTPSDTPT